VKESFKGYGLRDEGDETAPPQRKASRARAPKDTPLQDNVPVEAPVKRRDKKTAKQAGRHAQG
jgi:hypothetical protein